MALPTISPAGYRRVVLVAGLLLGLIVVTGAAVRLTGSGLGCTDWPTCEEGRLAPAEVGDAPAMIEFVNRTVTGVVSVAVAAAVLASLRRSPRRRDLTVLSLGLVAGVAAQAVLGGLVVLFELSPRLVMGHFLLSMVLVANAVVLHHRAGLADPGAGAGARAAGRGALGPARTGRPLGWALVAAAAVVVATGTVVSATGPHAGDEQAERLDLALPDVARVHGTSVVVLLALTLGALWVLHRDGAPARALDAGRTLLAVLVAQAAVGYVQWFTGVPALVVGVHILGALAVWVGVLHLHLVLGDPEPAAVPVSRGRVLVPS